MDKGFYVREGVKFVKSDEQSIRKMVENAVGLEWANSILPDFFNGTHSLVYSEGLTSKIHILHLK